MDYLDAIHEFGAHLLVAIGLAGLISGSVWYLAWRRAPGTEWLALRRAGASAVFVATCWYFVVSEWRAIRWGDSFCATCGLRREVAVLLGRDFVVGAPAISPGDGMYAERFGVWIPAHSHRWRLEREHWPERVWFDDLPWVDWLCASDVGDMVIAFHRASPDLQDEVLRTYGDVGRAIWTGRAGGRYQHWKSRWLAAHPGFR